MAQEAPSSQRNELLHRALAPLSKYYERLDVEEIAVNRDNEVWLKLSSGWQAEEDPDISYKYVMSVCRILANLTEQNFDMDVLPILSSTLPGGHRMQALIGPNVRYNLDDSKGMCLCIRRFKREKTFGLEDYELNPGQSLVRTEKQKMRQQRYSDTPFEDLVGAVANGEAVLISGATSTGKTTFMNALVEYIPKDRRIVTVEDTREVMLPHENRVHLVVSRNEASNNVGYTEVLDSVVRLTPDAIICGEISVVNSASIYRLMTTGHANFFATIHAESPEMALRAFWQNLVQSGMDLDQKSAMEIISNSFGRVVQIDRTSGSRVITDVALPNQIRDTMNAIAEEAAF